MAATDGRGEAHGAHPGELECRLDRDQIELFSNLAGGERRAMSFSSLTGFGADIIVVDDAHDMKNVDSMIRIPQDPGGAGRFQAHYLASKLRGYNVTTEREEGSKPYRANPFAAQCEHGFVKLVAGAWNNAFIEELCAFPHGTHDDQVDAAAAAFRALIRRRKWHVG